MLDFVSKKVRILFVVASVAILCFVLYVVFTNMERDDSSGNIQEESVNVSAENLELLKSLLQFDDDTSRNVANKLLNDVSLEQVQMLTQEVADMCEVSLIPEDFSEFVSKLAGYAMRNGLSMKDFRTLKQYVLDKGAEQFFVFLSGYGLSKQESADLLCAAAYATVHKQELSNKFGLENKYESLLVSMDTDLDEAQYVMSAVCGKSISKEHVANLLEKYSDVLSEVKNVNQLEVDNLFAYLSELLSVDESGLKMVLCAE